MWVLAMISVPLSKKVSCTAITKKTLPVVVVVGDPASMAILSYGIAQLKTLNKSAIATQLNKVSFGVTIWV